MKRTGRPVPVTLTVNDVGWNAGAGGGTEAQADRARTVRAARSMRRAYHGRRPRLRSRRAAMYQGRSGRAATYDARAVSYHNLDLPRWTAQLAVRPCRARVGRALERDRRDRCVPSVVGLHARPHGDQPGRQSGIGGPDRGVSPSAPGMAAGGEDAIAPT